MKKILFLGSKNKSDLVMYIALILKKNGYKTVIADATQKKTYLRSYTRYADQDTLYNFFNVEIAPVNSLQNLKSLMKSSGEDLNKYDFMLVDIDHVHDQYDWEDFEASYYVADYEKVTLLDDTKLMKDILANNDKGIIFNQVVYEVSSNIDSDYLDYLFNHKIKWSSTYKLPFDEMDVANKVDMQYNMKPTFKRLSKEFRNTLSSIITVLTGHHEKDTKIAMKQIEKGDY
ncbi:hypothetical protein [Metabacillus fastidiosus]|uniref:AAA domain-containing protein n=1 Tax=Metabacillus fastidiosus TaxID=1458 RepID=A0ABU6NT53_9BACI|nr:hypothetical protein [Metabacillus fastidiosus]MED4400326.1 hypothetical protein [Metabacillus fastidiosus]